MSFGFRNGEPYFCYRSPGTIKEKRADIYMLAREALMEARPGAFRFPLQHQTVKNTCPCGKAFTSDVPMKKCFECALTRKDKRVRPVRPRKVFADEQCDICQATFTPIRLGCKTCGPICRQEYELELGRKYRAAKRKALCQNKTTKSRN